MALPLAVSAERVDEVLALLGISEERVTKIVIDPEVITVTRQRLGADGELFATARGTCTVTEEIGIEREGDDS